MRLAAVQLRARPLEEAELALEEALDGIREAARQGAHMAVLPECTYPAYHLRSLEAWRAAKVRSWRDVTDRFGEVARETGLYVCVGIAFPGGALHVGRGENRAVLLDPQARILGYAAKRLLWHFDRDTFVPGRRADPVSTPLGPVGLAVCADMRAPEVARALVEAGARVLLDPTALVAAGDVEGLSNVQLGGLLQARARENGVPVVWADKVGTEDGLVRYVGQSGILDRTGRLLAQASPDRSEVISADVDLPAPGERPWTSVPGAEFPAARFAHTPGTGRDVFVAVTSGTARGAWAARIRSLRARFGAFPLTPEGPMEASWIAWAGPGRAETSPDSHTRSLVRDPATFRPGSRIARFRDLSVGVLFRDEVTDPRTARALAFSGADALVVFAEDLASGEALFWARVRAVENRLPVLVVGSAEGGTSLVLGPSGEVRTGTRPGEDFTAAAYLGVLETERREVAPGTPVAPVPLAAPGISRAAHPQGRDGADGREEEGGTAPLGEAVGADEGEAGEPGEPGEDGEEAETVSRDREAALAWRMAHTETDPERETVSAGSRADPASPGLGQKPENQG